MSRAWLAIIVVAVLLFAMGALALPLNKETSVSFAKKSPVEKAKEFSVSKKDSKPHKIIRVDEVTYFEGNKTKTKKKISAAITNSKGEISPMDITPMDNELPACYSLNGVKWNWQTFPITITLNPNNPQGIPQEQLVSAFSAAAETWDDSTYRNIFNNIIFTDTSVNFGVKDGKNAFVFKDWGNMSIIAGTTYWFDATTLEIREFDILFNTQYPWGDATTTGPDVFIMDLQNIATHEIGHGIGIGHADDIACWEQTMYPAATYNEIAKRTLEYGDLTALHTLYGEAITYPPVTPPAPLPVELDRNNTPETPPGGGRGYSGP